MKDTMPRVSQMRCCYDIRRYAFAFKDAAHMPSRRRQRLFRAVLRRHKKRAPRERAPQIAPQRCVILWMSVGPPSWPARSDTRCRSLRVAMNETPMNASVCYRVMPSPCPPVARCAKTRCPPPSIASCACHVATSDAHRACSPRCRRAVAACRH